jgi:hypothetical protein
MIDEGIFVAYRIGVTGAGAPWRIYSKSFDRYVASLHVVAARTAVQRDTPQL